MSERTPQTQDKYVLRLPDGMRDRIKAAAEANNRSMNAEIVHALGFYYAFDDLDPSRNADLNDELARTPALTDERKAELIRSTLRQLERQLIATLDDS